MEKRRKIFLKSVLLVVTLSLLNLAAACAGSPAAQEQSLSAVQDNIPLQEVSLVVPTIFCTGCQPRVEAAVKSVPGVREVRFNEEKSQEVTVIYDPSRTTPEAIIRAIEKGGDEVTEVIAGGKQ